MKLFRFTFFVLVLSVKGEGIFPNLDRAIANVVRVDSRRDVVIIHDKLFENTVARLSRRLFRLNFTITLFQFDLEIGTDGYASCFIDCELIINHLRALSDAFKKVVTVNLLSENAGFKWLHSLIKLPILKRPNKHIFVFDFESATNEAFRLWPDEVVATALLISMNRTSNVIQYFNLPCDIDDPVRKATKCRLVWRPDSYTSNYQMRKNGQRSKAPTYTVGIIRDPFRASKYYKDMGRGMQKFEGRLIQYLATVLQFNWKFIEVNSTSWGRLTENGTWDGLVGAVIDGQVDMVICQVTISAARRKVVDFSRAYWTEPIVILSKAGVASDSRFLVFEPFEVNLWIGLVLTVLLSGAFFAAMVRIFLLVDPSSKMTPLASEVSRSKLNAVVACTFHAYRTFFGHAVWQTPNLLSVRYYVLVLSVFGLFITVLYSTRLVLLMTFRTIESSVDTLEDLLQDVKNGNRFTLRNNSYLAFVFETSEDLQPPSIYNEIYNAAKSSGGLQYVVSEEDYVTVMRDVGENGGTAVHERSTILRFLGSINDSYKYHVSSAMFAQNLLGIVMKRGFRLKTEIDDLIDLLECRGILAQWFEWSLDVNAITAVQARQSPDSSLVIRFGDLAGAWAFYVQGIFVTVVAVVVENVYKWRQKRLFKRR